MIEDVPYKGKVDDVREQIKQNKIAQDIVKKTNQSNKTRDYLIPNMEVRVAYP